MAEMADAPDSKSGSLGREGSTPSLGTTQVLDKKHFKETEKKFLPNSCQEYPRGSGIKIREITNKHDGVSYKKSYQVTIPNRLSIKGRIRKQFVSLEEAKSYAKTSFNGIRRLGEEFLKIDNQQLKKAIKSIQISAQKPFKDVCIELIERKSELCSKGQIRPLTKRSFEGMALRISHSFAQNNIHEVSVKNIIKWVDGIRGGARTKRNYLNSLSEILNFAVLNDYIESNPLDKLTNSERRSLCGSSSEKGIAILKIEETKRLLATVKANIYMGLLDSIVLCLFCGIRTEEVKKLKWEDISFEKRLITISSEIAKKRSIRYVDIPNNALTWLKPLKKGFIVRSNYNSHYNNRLSKLIKLSGIQWKTNIMRHSFGSYHYGLYGDSLSTSKQLGHRQGDNILFSHYRNLVSYEDSKAYFEITDDS